MRNTIYLETGSADPYYNLAFEEFILCNRPEGDYLLLWQNHNTVVVGRNQNTEAEINRAFVQLHHINVVRRTTGGGAVYHDMGNLKKSEELFEKLSSVYQKKQMFLKTNSSASAIILGQYSRLLGNIMNYKKALYIDSVNLQYELNDFNLIHIENLLYNQAWAYYEIDREQNNQKIQRKFWTAQRIAEFNRKEELINLLKMRENKYLKGD